MNSHQRRKRRRAQDRGYADFLAWCAERCRCCTECSPTICDGVAQGAGCDRRCVCSRDEEAEPYDQEEDFET